jgi:TonB family protein
METPPTAAPTITPVETPKIASGPGMDQPVAILSQPRPSYTQEARKKRVEGTVVLEVVLRADGSIGTVSVVSGLPNGLSEQAIAAARNVKFVPAQKNGVAVSTVVQLEYNFRLIY